MVVWGGLGCVDCGLGCFVSCLIVLFSLLCFSLVVLFVYVRLWWVWLFAWAYGCCGLLCLLCLRCRCLRCEFSVCLLRFVVGVCLLLGGLLVVLNFGGLLRFSVGWVCFLYCWLAGLRGLVLWWFVAVCVGGFAG